MIDVPNFTRVQLIARATSLPNWLFVWLVKESVRVVVLSYFVFGCPLSAHISCHVWHLTSLKAIPSLQATLRQHR